MKIHALWGILILVFAIGCIGDSSEPETEEGISYICPEGWSITEELEYEDVGYYAACEKQNSSGVFVIYWFEVERDLNEALAKMKSDLEKGYTEQGVRIVFSEPKESGFKGYSALISNYAFSLLDVGYQGIIITFNCNKKNVVLLSQEAAKDHDENLADFGKIENSFVCG